MTNCESCTIRKAEPVPFIVHEGILARMERTIKRLWIVVLVLIGLLAASNGAWIWYESQFVDESWSYEATTDNGGTAVANGEGEVYIYGEGESDAHAPNP